MLARMWRKGNPFFTIGGNADWCSHCGKQYGGYSKKLKMHLPFDPAIPLLGIYPKQSKTLIQKNASTPMFTAMDIFTITCNYQDMEAAQVSINR